MWTEQCKEKQEKQEAFLRDVERQYSDIQIGFSQQNFDKHLQKYYIIKDLRELEQSKKGKLMEAAPVTQTSRSVATARNE